MRYDSARFRKLENENARLRRAVDELSMLNELSVEVGQANTVAEITRSIIRKARQAVGASEAVIMLVEPKSRDGMETLVRTRIVDGDSGLLRPTELLLELMSAKPSAIVIRKDDEQMKRRLGFQPTAIRTLVSVPMLIGGRLIGILIVYNNNQGHNFSEDDVRLLSIMAAQSAQIVEHARLDEERRSVIQTFGQYTSPQVVEEILRNGSDTEGSRRHVCILFMDVRGFSAYVERTKPEDVVAYLRTLFDITIDCVNRERGMVHQLLGDGLMAIFGAPVSHGNESVHAVRAAVEMLKRVRIAAEDGRIPATRLGIGLHAGEVVAGTIGSAVHREYKVTGDVVNVAARIEQLNKEFGSTLLISGSVYEELDPKPEDIESLGRIVLAGRQEAVEIFRLV